MTQEEANTILEAAVTGNLVPFQAAAHDYIAQRMTFPIGHDHANVVQFHSLFVEFSGLVTSFATDEQKAALAK